MNEVAVEFKCPTCKEGQLVQVREFVCIKEQIEGFFVAESPTPGKKYGLKTGFSGQTAGKVVRYECACCQFVPETQHGRWSVGGRPLKSPKDLFAWLKRHGMLNDTEVSATR